MLRFKRLGALVLPLILFAAGVRGALEEPPRLAITISLPPGAAQGDHQAKPEAMALVCERRTLELSAGENALELAGLPQRLEAGTLLLTPPAGLGIAVLETRWEGAPQRPEELLKSCLGKEVLVNRKLWGGDGRTQRIETINARLLGFDERHLVLGTDNRQLPVQIIPRNLDLLEIKLLAKNAPATRPALHGRLRSEKAGPAEMQLLYRTGGLEWRNEYDLIINNSTSADLSGWASLANASGASFAQARMRLAVAGQEMIELEEAVDLPDGRTVRAALFPGRAGLPLRIAPEEQAWRIDNSPGNGLGRVLPAGVVHVYRRSRPEAPPLWLGDVWVGNTPAGQAMVVKMPPGANVP